MGWSITELYTLTNQTLSKSVKKYWIFENEILNKIFQQGGP